MLPVVDNGRALANEFGLRQFRVYLRTRSYSGDLGDKTRIENETELTVVGGNPPKVVLLKTQEVASSGGRYADGDYRVGPFTPRYTNPDNSTGGYTRIDLDPSGSGVDVAYHIVGNGTDDYFSLVEAHFDRNFGYTLIVRAQHTR